MVGCNLYGFRFVKFYEKSFSLSVFSQFMGSIFVICVTCLQLSMVSVSFIVVGIDGNDINFSFQVECVHWICFFFFYFFSIWSVIPLVKK